MQRILCTAIHTQTCPLNSISVKIVDKKLIFLILDYVYLFYSFVAYFWFIFLLPRCFYSNCCFSCFRSWISKIFLTSNEAIISRQSYFKFRITIKWITGTSSKTVSHVKSQIIRYEIISINTIMIKQILILVINNR